MPAPRRIARLQQLVHEVAAETLLRRMADPRLRSVTVTRARLAPDLSEATVYWSALTTSETERRATARALSGAAPMVRTAVGDALGIRMTPRLRFRYDDTIAKAAHLEGIFERLRRERGEPEAPPAEPLAPPPAPTADEGPDGDAR